MDNKDCANNHLSRGSSVADAPGEVLPHCAVPGVLLLTTLISSQWVLQRRRTQSLLPRRLLPIPRIQSVWPK